MGIQERKEREREQRKSVIIDCAMQIFLSKGIANAKMEEIADCAELSRATLYTYFKNKEEVVLYVMNCVMGNFILYLEDRIAKADTAPDKVRMIGNAYLDFYLECHGQYLLLNSQESTADMEFSNLEYYSELLVQSNKLWSTICAPINEAIQTGYFKKGTKAIEIAITLWTAGNGLMRIMDHVFTTHTDDEMENCMQKDDYLRQMNGLDYYKMLKNLWNAIIASYQTKI
jgi:AcrR family transcriptional regulator